MQSRLFLPFILYLSAFTLATVVSASVQAGDIEWNGFGSAYYGQAFNSELLPPGFTDSSSDFSSFSLFGLNVGSQVNEQTRVAAQFVASSPDPNGKWNLNVKWAFINFSPMEHLTFKAGRQSFPVLIASEFDSVGYLLPYRSIPSAVSSIVPIEGFTGGSVNYVIDAGSSNHLTLAAFGGTPDYNLPAGVTGGAKDLTGLSATLDGDGYRVRAQYSRARASITFGPAFAPFNKSFSGTIDTVTGGFRYDKNGFVTWAEIADIASHDGQDVPYLAPGVGGTKFLQDLRGGYALFGYRVGRFLPRYTYSQVDEAVGVVQGRAVTHNLGLNYQISSQAVFKAEYQIDKVPSATDTGAGDLRRAVGSTATNSTSVYAGIDFIF